MKCVSAIFQYIFGIYIYIYISIWNIYHIQISLPYISELKPQYKLTRKYVPLALAKKSLRIKAKMILKH